MSIIKSNMTSPPPVAAGGGGLSSIGEMNSLLFHPDTGSLTYTLPNSGHSTDHTISLWIKVCGYNTTFQELLHLAVEPVTSRGVFIYNGKFTFNDGAGATCDSLGLIRDFSAWYHVVSSRSASEKKLWVNGVLQSTESTSGNSDFAVQGGKMSIGKGVLSGYMGASPLLNTVYLSDIQYVDGQTLTPHYFGSEVSDIWVPKPFNGASSDTDYDVSGASFTYGSNGFHLDFAHRGGHTIQTHGTVALENSSGIWALETPVPSSLSPTNQALAFIGSGSLKIDPFVPLTGDFTAECWFSRSIANLQGGWNYIFRWPGNVTSSKEMGIVGNTNLVNFWDENTGHTFGSHTSTSAWSHIAFVRENGVVSSYLDGVKLGVTYNQAATFSGSWIQIGDDMKGGLSHIRVSNVARYSGASISNWQNTTHSFTTDSNTLLLINDQNNIDNATFVDQSGSGDVSIGYDSSGNNNHWDVN